MLVNKSRCLSWLVLTLSLLAVPAAAQGPALQPLSALPDKAQGQATLESADFRATINTLGSGVTHFLLKDERYQRDGKPIDLVSTDRPQFLPLHFTAKGVAFNGPWQVLSESEGALRLATQASGLKFVRKLEVGKGRYQIWSTLRIENPGNAARKLDLTFEGHHYVERIHEKGGLFAGRSSLTASVLCVHDGKPERKDRKDSVEDHPSFEGKVSFGSVDTVYFTQAVAADGALFSKCRISGSDRGGSKDEPNGSLLTVALDYPTLNIPAHGSVTVRTLNYFGPKLPADLAAAGHTLPRASYVGGLPGVDTIAHSLVRLLSVIHDHVGNWGLAIILLTLLVKLVLFPLTAKSFASMASMRKLKPEIDKINEKYADDREKKGAAMMDLYKVHKINPLGGCLPQLFQLPIWWALYMSLGSNVELFRRPFFLFWQDLAAPDPYYVLPLTLGVLMWVQQKITPSTMDPAQAKMMLYMMPTMITAFMLFLPAGLCLYMLTNSVLSIAQQRFIEYRLNDKDGGANAAKLGTGVGSGSASDARRDSASPGRTGRGRA
jgi:YidC/Oxa1 family membrane protein insertase